MVAFVTNPTPINPIAQADGTFSQELRSWVQIITNRTLIIGAGTPESFVEAVQGAMYMDDTGTTGSILYLKRDSDIAGDKKLGWILV